jgi:hypothetical protein
LFGFPTNPIRGAAPQSPDKKTSKIFKILLTIPPRQAELCLRLLTLSVNGLHFEGRYHSEPKRTRSTRMMGVQAPFRSTVPIDTSQLVAGAHDPRPRRAVRTIRVSFSHPAALRVLAVRCILARGPAGLTVKLLWATAGAACCGKSESLRQFD